MEDLSRRKATFRSWTSTVDSAQLAQAGFYYSGVSDEVTCFSCKGQIRGWSAADIPFVVHSQRFPNCAFVQGAGPESMALALGGTSGQGSMLDSGVVQLRDTDNVGSQLSEEMNELDLEAMMESMSGDEDGIDQGMEGIHGGLADALAGIQGQLADVLGYANIVHTLNQHHAPAAAQQRQQRAPKQDSFAYYSSLARMVRGEDPAERRVPNVAAYKTELDRLNSYANWSAPVSASDCAKAGFFYSGEGDKVTCAFCEKVFKNWDDDDDPMEEHREYSPNCGFVKGENVGNIPLAATQAVHPVGGTRHSSHPVGVTPHPISQTIHPVRATAHPTPGGTPQPTMSAGGAGEHLPLQVSQATGGGEVAMSQQESFNLEELVKNTQQLKDSADFRLSTFREWRINISPQQMAAAGLYYTGEGDKVGCAHCNVTLKNWEQDDDPFDEHGEMSPQCPFIRSTPRPTPQLTNPTGGMAEPESQEEPMGGVEELPLQEEPFNLQELLQDNYQLQHVEHFRLRTFRNWPLPYMVPQQMAAAGLYYTGEGDKTGCAHCGRFFKKWDEGDDPLEEHKEMAPHCSFVKNK